MPTTKRWVATAILAIVTTIQPAGCRQERSATSEPNPETLTPASSTTPATTITATPTHTYAHIPTLSSKSSPQPQVLLLEAIGVPQDENAPIREGWARVIEKDDVKVRAWIEGSAIGGDKLVITTHNVRCFRLDFSRMRVDWSGKVLLRLDGFNSELTRKRYPRVTFVRSPTGAWNVRDD